MERIAVMPCTGTLLTNQLSPKAILTTNDCGRHLIAGKAMLGVSPMPSAFVTQELIQVLVTMGKPRQERVILDDYQ